jgi:Fe-S-cluster containining protein
MAVTRQQRRQRARELAGIGQSMVRRGVPRAPGFADLLGLTLVFRQALTGKGPPSPAVACAEIAHKTFEASVRADPATAPIACRKGCAYCCYGTVMVTAPEAFRLAHEVAKAKPGRPEPERAAFLARAEATANLTAAERFGRKLACPLLADDLCSAYAARPLSCRRVTSFAVEPCLEEYEGQAGDILMPKKPLTHAGNTQIPLLAALKTTGRPVRLYELAAAVRSVLETRDAEAGWLAGEDIFSSVTACEEPGPELVGLIDRLSAEVRSID